MCTYTVVTHPCHIPPLAQARPMMLCIYTIVYHEKSQLNRLVWGSLTLAPIIYLPCVFRKCKLNSFNPFFFFQQTKYLAENVTDMYRKVMVGDVARKYKYKRKEIKI